ncbi:MAG TPA: hypothetical protein VFA65_24530 [Bryobacteraceae bacterium]|nr:hypothetical protein [Bryobacteraceae bacterium]
MRIGKKLFQVVWWGLAEHWTCWGYWRWPPLEERLRGETVLPGKWINFGFHSFSFGPVELRYWPNNRA